MSSEMNELMEYATQQFGVKEEVGETEIVPTENNAEPQDQVGTEIVAEIVAEDTPQPEAQVETPASIETKPEIDYWKQFEEKSGGLVKDEESLTTFLAKANGYEELAKQKEELEKNQWKPANSFIETYDALTKEGASKDQLNAFIKLNQYGDLNDLSPIEAKVAKLVLVDGYDEAIARKVIEKDFDLEEHEEGSDEYLILKEKLRVSSKSDLAALETYRKELSVIDNPDKANAEQNRLNEIAQQELFTKSVKQEAPKIAQYFPNKFNYELQDGEAKVPYEYNMDKKFMENELPGLIENYFLETGEERNQDNIKKAFECAHAEYLLDNHANIINDVWKKASSYFAEKYSNKYENRSGLPREHADTSPEVVNSQMDEFYKRIGVK